MRMWLVMLAVVALAGCKRGDKNETKVLPATAAVAKSGGMHVWDPNVVVLDKAATGAKEIERVPIGTKVTVEKIGGNPDYLKIVDGTKKKGFLLARSVREGKPDAALLLVAVREKLGAGDLASSSENAERVAALGGASLGEALDVLEAIHEAQGNPRDATRVRQLRVTSKLPAPTPTPDAAAGSAKAAAAGELRWVSATKLLLKDKPDVSAKTVAEVSINTQVKVTAVKGEWLAIEATLITPSVFRIEVDGLVNTISGKERVVRGFARPRFLADAPLSRDTLVKEADAFEARGELGEAVRRLERATAIDPDPGLVQRLARLSAQAKLYRIAARASGRLTRGADGAGQLEVADITTVWGCRGDLSEAVIFSSETDHPDACLTNVPTHDECQPCGPSGIMISEAEFPLYELNQRHSDLPGDASQEEKDAEAESLKEQRTSLEAALQEAKDAYAREQKDHEEAQKAWETSHDTWQKEDGRLRALYPKGPYARIVLPQSDEKGSLFAWSRTAQILEDYCGNMMLGWSSTNVSQEIPAKSDRERTFWVYVDDPDVAIFGIEGGASAEAIQHDLEKCEQGDPSENPGYSTCGPSQGQFPKLQSCGCCGC